MENNKKQKKARVGDFIIDSRQTAEGEKYLIKWKNLKNESSTWELKQNVEERLLERYEDKKMKKIKIDEQSQQ